MPLVTLHGCCAQLFPHSHTQPNMCASNSCHQMSVVAESRHTTLCDQAARSTTNKGEGGGLFGQRSGWPNGLSCVGTNGCCRPMLEVCRIQLLDPSACWTGKGAFASCVCVFISSLKIHRSGWSALTDIPPPLCLVYNYTAHEGSGSWRCKYRDKNISRALIPRLACIRLIPHQRGFSPPPSSCPNAQS